MAEPERIVIADTTPLINLVGVGLLDLLPQLYGTILIAQAVYREYNAGSRPIDPRLATLAWIRIVSDVPPGVSLPRGLGAGEAATISLAITLTADAVLLDEQLARRVARQRDLPVVGTLGVLLAAKQSGLLSTVRPAVDAMTAQGRHISSALRARILLEAEETE